MASKQNAENPKETSKTSEKDTEPELQGKMHKWSHKLSCLLIIITIIIKQKTYFISDLESSLLALERLESGSPEFWPDHSKFEHFSLR